MSDRTHAPPRSPRRRSWIGLLAAMLSLDAPAPIAGAGPASPQASPRNVLLITLDTTRADRLGCYGWKPAATPNLDGLARAGVLFERCLSPAPLTLPSHATIMTGLTPRHHGVRDNSVFRLEPSFPTLASLLQAKGFATAAVVASSILERGTGIGRGFAVFDDSVRIGAREAFNYEERAASQVHAAAREVLDGLTPPFFLWVHYYDPHYPYVPPDPIKQRFASRPYDGEIAFVDEAIGRLLGIVRSRGLAASTIVVVAGDHGESLGEHGEDRHDLFVYQSTQRVPLILSGPALPRGLRVSAQVGLVDIAPTLLDLLDLPPIRESDGISLLPLLRPAEARRRQPPRFFEIESLYPGYAYGWAPAVGIVSGRWKYIGLPRPELYDLDADPNETVNLLARMSVEGAGPHGSGSQESPSKRPAAARTGPETGTLQEASRLAGELRTRYARDGEARRFGAPFCVPSLESRCTDPREGVPPAPEPALGNAPSDEPLTSEEREKLRSLGYAGGTASPGGEPLAGPLRDPKDGVAIVRDLAMAQQRLQEGRVEQALDILERRAREDPRNIPLLATLGAAQGAAGRHDAAIASFRTAIALRPGDGLAHLDLANALRAKAASIAHGRSTTEAGRVAGLREEAGSEYARALAINPRDSETYLAAAELEIERSSPASALSLLERAEAAQAGDPDIFVLLGRLRASRGEAAGAREAFQRALRLDDRSARAWEGLGALAFASGESREAESHYARALELTPTVPLARTLGAIRLDALDDPRGALVAFRRALELARGQPEEAELATVVRELEALLQP